MAVEEHVFSVPHITGRAVSTVVVVGDQFNPAMFDFSTLFGPADPNQMLVGPFAHISYRQGLCGFNVVPNRIDIRVTSDEILPAELLEAAGKIADVLAAMPGLPVTAVGLNHDAFLSTMRPGVEHCRALTHYEDVLALLGTPAATPLVSFRFDHNSVEFTVRMEPEAADGNRLFVAVNGNFPVPAMSIRDALAAASDVRTRVEGIHARLRD